MTFIHDIPQVVFNEKESVMEHRKTFVARVRRRDDRPPSRYGVCLENIGRQGILVFYQWKIGMGVAT
jgi:hypothetical protein